MFIYVYSTYLFNSPTSLLLEMDMPVLRYIKKRGSFWEVTIQTNASSYWDIPKDMSKKKGHNLLHQIPLLLNDKPDLISRMKFLLKKKRVQDPV